MTEDFLQFVWKYRLFSDMNKYSTAGDEIEIIEVGKQNFDSGPDFFDARIKVGDVLWAGNVEIHVKASSWTKHGHNNDPAYDNVVLHVVCEDDADVVLENQRQIPCLELDFNSGLLKNYNSLMASKKWIPCFDEISSVENFFIKNWLDRMLIERLERKSDEIQEVLIQNDFSWEDTFYQVLARYFGMKVNAEPFHQLARSIPMKYLARQKNSLFQLEALLFGQSGLLDRFVSEDAYHRKLVEEYRFLSSKYKLKPLSSNRWKWLRLRPNNFPTIRIAQFASLVHKSDSLFSKILEANNVIEISQLLNCEVSEYWKTHYQFGFETKKTPKGMGLNGVNVLIINAVVPILFLYGKLNDIQKFKDKACGLLEDIPMERNAITKKWKECGVQINSAHYSQALLHLKSNYCDCFNCLKCEFGNRIIRNIEA